MKIMNKKGFTLVELLVVIVILGIITGLSIPLIRNIEQRNRMSKFKVFEDSLIEGAKLYVDAYGEYDIDENGTTICVDIDFKELKKKNLIKDFNEKSLDCNNENTFVRILREYSGKYKYEVKISCYQGAYLAYEVNKLSDNTMFSCQ